MTIQKGALGFLSSETSNTTKMCRTLGHAGHRSAATQYVGSVGVASFLQAQYCCPQVSQLSLFQAI
eukprot:3337569-Amphidinium_carterae.1